jgi:hypothetical protein
MKNPSKTARRALVSITALALAGGALAAAGPASAAPGDDITGTVVNAAGTPLANVTVYAYTTPGDASAPQFVDSAFSDVNGVYVFDDLDPATLAADYPTNPAINLETEFKLFFYWSPNFTTPADYHSTGYLDRGLGGAKTIRGSGSVAVPAGTTVTAPTQALPGAGGVLLRVLNPAGTPVTFGQGQLFEADAADPFSAESAGFADTFDDDNFYPDVDANGDGIIDPPPADGLVYIAGVEPDSSYVVNASGSDFNATTGVETEYASRLFGGDGSYSKATPVAVTTGAFTPVTVQLSNTLTVLEKPRIIGNSSFGSKLTADPGTFLGESGLEYTYQWFSGSKLVSTTDTYKVSKKDKGNKIKLTVTALGDDFIGTASADKTSKVGEKSKVSVKKAGLGKFNVTVKVAKKKLAQKLGTPTGKVVLMTEDGETASKKVRLQGGSATLTARAKYLGEKLVVVYLGGGRLGSDTAATSGGKKK